MNSKKTYTVQKSIGDIAHSGYADHHAAKRNVCEWRWQRWAGYTGYCR